MQLAFQDFCLGTVSLGSVPYCVCLGFSGCALLTSGAHSARFLSPEFPLSLSCNAFEPVPKFLCFCHHSEEQLPERWPWSGAIALVLQADILGLNSNGNSSNPQWICCFQTNAQGRLAAFNLMN